MDILEKAGQFLQAHGRTLEQMQFAYHFAQGEQSALLDALAHYQNADGGFGNALEQDIAAPDSNPFAIELALQICLQAQVPPDHPLLARTVAYLEKTQEADGGWRFSPAIYQHELAPWFQGWQFPTLNPSCTLAALLTELGLGSRELHKSVQGLFDQLANPADVAGDDFYGVRPYAYYFLPASALPQREFYLAGVLWWVVRQHLKGEIDGNHFFAYVRHPQTYTARNLPADLLNQRLDALLAEQEADGGWPSPYAPHWRGPITIQNLLTLHAFGRV